MSKDHADIVFGIRFLVAFVSGNFPLLQQRSWIQTYFCNYPQYPCLFGILFEYTPSIHDLGKMLVSPNQRLSFVLSRLD